MNVGKMITRSLQEQRHRDVLWLLSWCVHGFPEDPTRYQRYGYKAYHALLAYWWWGWDINGRGGLGKPGGEV